MVRFLVTKESAASVDKYTDAVRKRVFAAVTEAMGEEMVTLADTVVSKLHGNPITGRTGKLEQAILQSPKVVDSPGATRGSVSAQDGALNLGLWLEKGHRFPGQRLKQLELSNKRNILKRLSVAQIDEMRSRGGRVKPYPFLVPSLEERETPILEHIREKVADALAQ